MVWLKNAADGPAWCGRAAIVIVGDKRHPEAAPCAGSSDTQTIDRMQLARHGSAALWHSTEAGWRITYAIDDPSMPWHEFTPLEPRGAGFAGLGAEETTRNQGGRSLHLKHRTDEASPGLDALPSNPV